MSFHKLNIVPINYTPQGSA